MKGWYKRIKDYSLNHRILTQIVLVETLSNKNVKTITTNIMLQIFTKIGNLPWYVSSER
jgi:argonaute-like protein implicated in RNA metabolism and viral defense